MLESAISLLANAIDTNSEPMNHGLERPSILTPMAPSPVNSVSSNRPVALKACVLEGARSRPCQPKP